MQQRDNVQNTVYNHNRLTEIIQEGATGVIPSLRSRDIALLNKHVNEVNEVLKGVPVHNLIGLKNVARAGVLLVCEKVGIRGDQNKKAKKPFWKRRIEKKCE